MEFSSQPMETQIGKTYYTCLGKQRGKVHNYKVKDPT